MALFHEHCLKYSNNILGPDSFLLARSGRVHFFFLLGPLNVITDHVGCDFHLRDKIKCHGALGYTLWTPR